MALQVSLGEGAKWSYGSFLISIQEKFNFGS